MNTEQHPTPTAGLQAEKHPLRPFLPENAKLLMLGSFPPPRKRWCMDFFYPNWGNDMWRIWGQIAEGDKNHFVVHSEKRFDQGKIEAFCLEKGIALYDTAEEVVRLKNNASDNFLQVVRPTDLHALLRALPQCRAIVTTGQKATDTLCDTFHAEPPAIGHYSPFEAEGRILRLYRMPSSSRAYPLKLETKAAFYRSMAEEIGLL